MSKTCYTQLEARKMAGKLGHRDLSDFVDTKGCPRREVQKRSSFTIECLQCNRTGVARRTRDGSGRECWEVEGSIFDQQCPTN